MRHRVDKNEDGRIAEEEVKEVNIIVFLNPILLLLLLGKNGTNKFNNEIVFKRRKLRTGCHILLTLIICLALTFYRIQINDALLKELLFTCIIDVCVCVLCSSFWRDEGWLGG